ncbi:hypothetical protein LCGC14_1663000 [marine sediment metagenome]|uniref:Uncharacterized protein n=1 Tax=marine sediment metagenome TaxID=412755 RepID=A0A0F9IG11_9ZZZZ
MPRMPRRRPDPPGGPPPWPHGPPPWAGSHSGARFLILGYAHSWVDNTLNVATATDVPCHMFLRWTRVSMKVHMHEKTIRGLTVMGDPKYCFVEWLEVEQTEEGDTFNHSFSFPGWAEGEQRWWHFRAVEGGVDSPSTTGIFTAIYQEQKAADSLEHPALGARDPLGVMDHADEAVTGAKLVAPFAFLAMPFTPAEPPTQDYHVANKAYVDALLGG